MNLLAAALELPKSAVEVVAGQTTRRKQVCVAGLTEAVLRARLMAILSRRGAARERAGG